MRPTKRHINRKLLLFPFAILAIVLIACGSLPEETATALVTIQPQGDVIRDATPDNSSSASESSEEDIVPSVAATRQHAPQLEVIIPPCVQFLDSAVDPCERRDSWPHHQPYIQSSFQWPEIWPTLRETIVLHNSPRDIPHFIVRATVIPQSIRCGQSDVELIHESSYAPVFPERLRRGQPNCFVEIAVNEYLVGGGPTRLTVNTRVKPVGLVGDDPDCDSECLDHGVRIVRSTDIEGREWIYSLGGPRDLGTLAWDIVYRWDVQLREDGEVVAVDYWKRDMLSLSTPENYDENLSRLEHTLDDFRSILIDAHHDLVKKTRGRVTTETDKMGNPATLMALDAGPGALSDFVFSTTAIERLNVTPTNPPPVPGEGDPNPDGLRINDIVATRVAGGVRIPGGQEDTPTPVSALGDEPTATATPSTPAKEELDE